jgi:tetratricopeptide (TPR) repeat protein
LTKHDRSAKPSSLPSWATPYVPDFEELLRVVQLADGFVLQPIEIPGPDLAHAFAEWLTAKGHRAVVREPQNDDEWKDITGWLLTEAEVPADGVVFVIGNREPPEGVHLAMRLLNERRDRIVKRLGRPLFWCGPPSFLALTRERAPDFWSIRAVERRFEAKPDLIAEAKSQGDLVSAARLGIARAREALFDGRLDEAEKLLDGVPEVPGDEELRYWPVLLRAVLSLRCKRPEEAVAILKRHKLPKSRVLGCYAALTEARAYDGVKRKREASRLYDEAAALAHETGVEELRSLVEILQDARRDWRDESALLWLRNNAKRAEKNGDIALAALARAQLARVSAELLDSARARQDLEEAMELAAAARGQRTVLLGGEIEDAIENAKRLLGDSPDAHAHDAKTNEKPWWRKTRVLVAALSAVSATLSAAIVQLAKPPPRPWCFQLDDKLLCADTSHECERQRDRATSEGKHTSPCLRVEFTRP